MALTFRKALPADGGDGDRVLRSAFTPYVRKLGREITADYYAWVGAAVDRDDVFVALEAGQRGQIGRRGNMPDQGGGKARGIAGAEAVHEQRGEPEKKCRSQKRHAGYRTRISRSRLPR